MGKMKETLERILYLKRESFKYLNALCFYDHLEDEGINYKDVKHQIPLALPLRLDPDQIVGVVLTDGTEVRFKKIFTYLPEVRSKKYIYRPRVVKYPDGDRVPVIGGPPPHKNIT